MFRLVKTSMITLLAALTLASVVSGAIFPHHKKVVIYYQSASGTTWYEVRTVKTSAPVYTYTTPVSSAQIYIYQAPAAPPAIGDVKIVAPAQPASVWVDGQYAGTTDNIMQLGLEAGGHDVMLKDSQGNTLFSGSVDVVAGQTTQVQPQ